MTRRGSLKVRDKSRHRNPWQSQRTTEATRDKEASVLTMSRIFPVNIEGCVAKEAWTQRPSVSQKLTTARKGRKTITLGSESLGAKTIPMSRSFEIRDIERV